MLNLLKIFFAGCGLAALLCASVWAGPEKKKNVREAWTIEDTVAAALNYSPAVKSSREGIKMQKESVREARAGHLPRVDAEATGGAATLPVSRYE